MKKKLIVYKIGNAYYYQGNDGLYQLPISLDDKEKVKAYIEKDGRYNPVFSKSKFSECEIYRKGLVRNIS